MCVARKPASRANVTRCRVTWARQRLTAELLCMDYPLLGGLLVTMNSPVTRWRPSGESCGSLRYLPTAFNSGVSWTENSSAGPASSLRCSWVAQLGITNMSPAVHEKRIPSMMVAPEPSNARYTELPVCRCARVWTPGRSICIQHVKVAITGPPVWGFVYSSATSSNGSAAILARLSSARWVSDHLYVCSGDRVRLGSSQAGRSCPTPYLSTEAFGAAVTF